MEKRAVTLRQEESDTGSKDEKTLMLKSFATL